MGIACGSTHPARLDTQMALGSDMMSNAVEGYAFLKVAGKSARLVVLLPGKRQKMGPSGPIFFSWNVRFRP